MQIDRETLARVAKIARLKPGEQEMKELQKDLDYILEAFSKINELELEDEELHYIVDKVNALRKDGSPADSVSWEEIMRQVPRKEESLVKVPKSL